MSLSEDLDRLARLVEVERFLRDTTGVEFARSETGGLVVQAHDASLRELLGQIRIVAARNTGDPP